MKIWLLCWNCGLIHSIEREWEIKKNNIPITKDGIGINYVVNAISENDLECDDCKSSN